MGKKENKRNQKRKKYAVSKGAKMEGFDHTKKKETEKETEKGSGRPGQVAQGLAGSVTKLLV